MVILFLSETYIHHEDLTRQYRSRFVWTQQTTSYPSLIRQIN